MQSIQHKDFIEAVGQGFITMKMNNFPVRGWARKTVGNVIYIWAKYEVDCKKISGLEKSTGKDVKFSIVLEGFIKQA